MKKIVNIRRIDNEVNRTHAWLVQVQRNSNTTIKMFSDGVYGGKRKALTAAKEFHAQVLAAVSEYDYHMQIRSTVRRNNSSGIAGVGRYDYVTNPNTGARVTFWLAYWDDEHGVRHQRKFSVFQHGEKKAKELAIAERKMRLQEVCAAKCG